MKRRDFCRTMAVAVGVGGVAAAHVVPARAQASGPPTADVAQIYQLQAAFHRAKTAQDIELMMSLWDPKATLKVQGDPQSPYVGTEQLQGFWQHSGSFKTGGFRWCRRSRHASRSVTTTLTCISSVTTWRTTTNRRAISSITRSWPERCGMWAGSGYSMT